MVDGTMISTAGRIFRTAHHGTGKRDHGYVNTHIPIDVLVSKAPALAEATHRETMLMLWRPGLGLGEIQGMYRGQRGVGNCKPLRQFLELPCANSLTSQSFPLPET